MRRRGTTARTPRRQGALALAIRRDDWELAALLLLHGIVTAARALPPGAIDDVLALLDAEARREPRPDA
jgi:hypothetical protein